MKKFFRTLIILIIIGALGAGFYFGWLQIKLGENEYGVIHTRTSGWDEDILVPGKFTWRWEALIPRNLTLHIFHVVPRHESVEISGSLPSGELYGNFFEGTPDFSYNMELTMDYKLDPSTLPSLIQLSSLSSDSLASWYDEKENKALTEVAIFLKNQFSPESDFINLTDIIEEEFISDLMTVISEKVPELDITGAMVTRLELPDVVLYQKAREYYFSMMDTKLALNEEALKKAAVKAMDQSVNLELLEKYGELFSNYPSLLEYLSSNPSMAEELLLSNTVEE